MKFWKTQDGRYWVNGVIYDDESVAQQEYLKLLERKLRKKKKKK